MEIVTCYCLKCKAELGRFRNSWNGIGNTYFSPVHRPLSVDGFESTGNIYEAAQGSQIEDSLLQDLACARCQNVLGLRCDSAPDGHILHHNQMILRLAEMSVMSEESGTKAKISIMKTFPLKHSGSGAKSLPGSRRASASTSQPVSRPKPPRLLPGISRTPSATSRMSTPIPTPPQSEVAKFKTRAEDAIKSQQQDIDRLSGSVDRIERDMRLFKDFMEEVRTKLASNRQLQGQGSEEGLSVFREELDELRQRIQLKRARPVSRGNELSRRSLEVIAQDVQLVSQKVDEVDELKRELEQLKTRINSLEGPASNAAVGIAHSSKETHTGGRDTRARRKRNQSQMHSDEPTPHDGQAMSPELPTKRRKTRKSPTHAEAAVAENNISNGQNRQAGARKRDAVDIPTSEGASSSPILDEDEEQGQFNYVEDDSDDDYQPPEPATPVLESRRSGGEGRTDFTSAATPASLPTSEHILHLKTVLEPDNRMRKSDIARGRNRAPNGLLLTKYGTVDRRSLRLFKLFENEENLTPSRPSLASETLQAGHKNIVDQQSSDPLELPLLPSIERIGSALEARSTPQPGSSSSNFSMTPRVPKPFKCGSCDKQYVARSGLQYHQKNARNKDCRQGKGNICPTEFPCDFCGKICRDMQKLEKHRCLGEIAKRIALEDMEPSLAHRGASVAAFGLTSADRARLVRQTMEREMSAAF